MKLRNRKDRVDYDLWDGESTEKPKKLHPSNKRPKKRPLPHPGQSYNPDPLEHSRLLAKVADKEISHQKKEASLKRAMQIKIDPEELREDEDSDASSTDAASDNNDSKAICKDKRVVEQRKTKQQRLRQMRDKLQRRTAKLRKLKNIRDNKFGSIKRLIKELDKRDREAALKCAGKRHNRLKTERLGQKFEHSDPIYCLSSELPSSLRSVSCPMDALVREQLENFQSRLLVEPTSFQIKSRKYKRKEYDRTTAAEDQKEALG